MTMNNSSGTTSATKKLPQPYEHLLRSRKIEDLWLMRILNRLCCVTGVCLRSGDSPGQIFFRLRVSIDAESKFSVATRLRATNARMQRLASRYKLPQVLSKNLIRLNSRIALSQTEQRILALAVLIRSNQGIYDAAAESNAELDVARQVARVIGSTHAQVAKALAPNALLRRTRLLEITAGGSLRDNLQLQRGSFRSLAQDPNLDIDALLTSIVRPGKIGTVGPQWYGHLSPPLPAVASVLGEALTSQRIGVNILLYGPPGSGKTELSRLLSMETGASLFEVASNDLDGQPLPATERLNGVATCQVLLAGRRSLLLFDEIDAVFTDNSRAVGKLATAEGNKSWVNEMLEGNPVPTIWIANRIDEMDPAFIRRFDLVIHLEMPPISLRRRLLEFHCGKFLEQDQIRRFAQIENATPAVIARAANVVQRMGDGAGKATDLLESVLDGVLVAQGHAPVRNALRDVLPSGYDPSLCNADMDLVAIAAAMKKNATGRICLFGPPGTGKTAYGYWLARDMDRPLLLKRYSEIQSPFLGVMEQNLASAFEQAEREGAILQFDEVDSYLRDRSEAQRSWEITQVNEFLTQLESFSGVFIASTNLVSGLDPASLRRFDYKVRVGYLRPEQVHRMLCDRVTIFGLPGDPPDLSDLVNLDQVTPGDFAVVDRRHSVTPYTSTLDVLTSLRQEVAFKVPIRRNIGFV